LLAFESDTKLTRIETHAFWACVALKSIWIPQGIQQLENDSYLGSSLDSVIFESRTSLQTMIEGKKVDLEGYCDICLVDCASVMSFPGSSVCPIPGVDHSVRLPKNE
jgi:hypothetical protein